MNNPKVKLFVALFSISFLIVVVGAFLLTAGKTIGQSLFGRGFAEGQLKAYVSDLTKQEINGSRCQAVDSDGNGYVSCDYTTVAQPNVPYSAECAAWGMDGFLNRGCRSRRPF
ncbi:MAG: hypothetical protein KME35_21885 [Aphanocapsa sp. GSE-SYN-MK-11-07L]|jgi:hypothetical protein|nr:hypothetical protein [Aphanocapsa sp. GSE-SYN-MK-11-07L]